MSMYIQMYGRMLILFAVLLSKFGKCGMWFWYCMVELYDFVCMVAVFFCFIDFSVYSVEMRSQQANGSI